SPNPTIDQSARLLTSERHQYSLYLPRQVNTTVDHVGGPTLHGAIIAKGAAATDDRTTGHPRHIQDVAFLLALIEDPVDFAVATN
ncbi:MAG: hypothetical protein ABI862_20960, partial [Ilumatobacteraceae bacterium]